MSVESDNESDEDDNEKTHCDINGAALHDTADELLPSKQEAELEEARATQSAYHARTALAPRKAPATDARAGLSRPQTKRFLSLTDKEHAAISPVRTALRAAEADGSAARRQVGELLDAGYETQKELEAADDKVYLLTNDLADERADKAKLVRLATLTSERIEPRRIILVRYLRDVIGDKEVQDEVCDYINSFFFEWRNALNDFAHDQDTEPRLTYYKAPYKAPLVSRPSKRHSPSA